MKRNSRREICGASIQFDKGKVEAIQVQTCDDKGCYAGAPLPAPMLEAQQSTATLTVTFQDLKLQGIAVTVPMAGFAMANQKLP